VAAAGALLLARASWTADGGTRLSPIDAAWNGNARMELVLQIVNGDGPAARDRRKVFGRAGGRIGRAVDCEWVLPSPYISRHHATVTHAGNTFYIESMGENGVALNDPAQMLAKFERHALKHGDRLFIDEMEIAVQLAGVGLTTGAPVAIPELADPSGTFELHADDLGPLNRLLADASSGVLSETGEHRIAWNNSSSLADHFTPPRVEQSSGGSASLPVAEDWDFSPSDMPPVQEALNRRAAQSETQIAGDVASAPVLSRPTIEGPLAPVPSRPALEGSPAPVLSRPGIEGTADKVPPTAQSPSPPIAATDLILSLLQGLIDERQTRAQVAAELRLRAFPLTPTEPNPLRHAVNAQDAMRLMFSSPDITRMSAAQAIADAFEELRAHQLATCSAIQIAFQSMLSRFDPQALEELFERRLKNAGVLPIGSRFRYWQLYIELFEQLASDPDGGFQKLFGEAFAGAYESHLTTLKGRRTGTSA
jgi:type VI secretion system protein